MTVTSDTSFSMLACQIDIPHMTTVAERDAHLVQSTNKVRAALSSNPADLVVLPELSSIDYSRETFAELTELAEPLDGPSFTAWQSVARAHKTHIAYSFPRRGEHGNHISLAVINPEGELVGHYDKIHLAQYGASMEKEYFERGNHLFTFTIKDLKFAPIICYDIRIPELTRALVVDHHVDVILHCGAYYRDESFHTWHAFATTRAMENQVFYLSLNRAGQNYGNSLFCSPWMDENRGPEFFDKHSEQLKYLAFSTSEIAKTREKYSFLKDRLPDYAIPTLRA